MYRNLNQASKKVHRTGDLSGENCTDWRGKSYFLAASYHDILTYPELRENTITLMDLAQEPLDFITSFANKIVRQTGFGTKIESTTDRQKPGRRRLRFITIRVGDRKIHPMTSHHHRIWCQGSPDTVGAEVSFTDCAWAMILDICHDMENFVRTLAHELHKPDVHNLLASAITPV